MSTNKYQLRKISVFLSQGMSRTAGIIKKNYTSAVQKVAKRGKTDFFKNSLKKLLHMEIL